MGFRDPHFVFTEYQNGSTSMLLPSYLLAFRAPTVVEGEGRSFDYNSIEMLKVGNWACWSFLRKFHLSTVRLHPFN